ncbi:rna-binding protein [Stylonychia lemnae]|uniref:Rna-binding protein n=1 Tax=Stylonychia lemnae TaxID=5949 RepID=A0A078AZR8_STYLE|nr:rna-binding protein [Stylonychia lemnae]|eukprot:CDW87591.1 rna-binding protein [Stylonychia lemnae]
MISLYVCDFPQTLEKEDLESLFQDFEGFIEVRLAKDKNGQKIAFVDYQDNDQAKKAQNSCSGFRYTGASKGLCVRFSEHNKRDVNNRNGSNNSHIGRSNNQNGYQNRQYTSGSNNNYNQKENFNQSNTSERIQAYSQSLNQRQDNSSNFQNQQQSNVPRSILKNSSGNGVNQQLSMGNSSPVNQHQQSSTLNSNPSQSIQGQSNSSPSSQILNYGNLDMNMVMNIINSLKDSTDFNGASSLLQGDILASLTQNPQLLSTLLNINLPQLSNNNNTNATTTANSSASYPSPISNQAQSFQNLCSNLQSNPLIHQTNPLLSSLSVQNGSIPHSVISPSLINQLGKLSGFFRNNLPIPKHATNTVYIEGLPHDTSVREVARKFILLIKYQQSLDIFRPFIGFKELRLIPRSSKDGQKVHIAFADFESTFQTTMVINTLQGYRFHKDDIIGLQFSYAVENNKHGNHGRH